MADARGCENSHRLAVWQEAWKQNIIRFHLPIVNQVLKKQISSLTPEGTKVLVPLCGKTLDMRWLADHGYIVVGVDGVKKALEEFYKDQGLDWHEEEASSMGPGCQLLQATDKNIRFYCGDIMLFNQSVQGQFDFIWDRAALVALYREDTLRYTKVMKDVLSANGKILLETVEYDAAIMEGFENTPPPFPMSEADVKFLFGPQYEVEFLERRNFTLLGKDIHVAYYMIARKQ